MYENSWQFYINNHTFNQGLLCTVAPFYRSQEIEAHREAILTRISGVGCINGGQFFRICVDTFAHIRRWQTCDFICLQSHAIAGPRHQRNRICRSQSKQHFEFNYPYRYPNQSLTRHEFRKGSTVFDSH